MCFPEHLSNFFNEIILWFQYQAGGFIVEKVMKMGFRNFTF